MFKKMPINKYPPRFWALVSHPGDGKSTFATQMKTPLLPIDSDGRFAEVAGLATGKVYQLSDTPADNSDPATVAGLLDEHMPGSGVATVCIDSLTAIIAPIVTKTIQANDAGENKNLIAAFKEKALAMRRLQDAVTKWGCDVLWIYHLNKGRDNKAKKVVNPTLSKTERARLYRSLNLELHIVRDGDRRGVKVVWARRGRSGMTLWDDSGHWAGMPEEIERAVYDGLSEAEQAEIETQPGSFPSPEAAMNWGLEQGAFSAIQHARNAYDKLRDEHSPSTAADMWALWIADVERRLAEAKAEPAPQPRKATNGGKTDVISPTDFHAPATNGGQGHITNPAGLLETVNKLAGGHYPDAVALHSALGDWPDFNNPNAVGTAVSSAVDLANSQPA